MNGSVRRALGSSPRWPGAFSILTRTSFPQYSGTCTNASDANRRGGVLFTFSFPLSVLDEHGVCREFVLRFFKRREYLLLKDLRRLTLACTGSITRFSRNIRPHQRFVGGSSDQPPVSAMRPTSLWEELTRMRLAGRTSIVLRIRSLSTSSELPPAYPVKCLVAARVLTSVVLSPAARPAQSRKSSSCSSARARPHHRRRRGARRRLRREG